MIDSLDEQLITLLGEDASKSSKALAKQLNVSQATIRRRIKDLMNSGALRIVGVVEPEKIDRKKYYSFIDFDTNKLLSKHFKWHVRNADFGYINP